MRWQRSKWQNSEAFPERPHRDLRLLCSTGSRFFRPESSRRRSPETGASSGPSRCESDSIRLMLSGRGRCSRSQWRPTGPSRGQHRWLGNKMNPVDRLLLNYFNLHWLIWSFLKPPRAMRRQMILNLVKYFAVDLNLGGVAQMVASVLGMERVQLSIFHTSTLRLRSIQIAFEWQKWLNFHLT